MESPPVNEMFNLINSLSLHNSDEPDNIPPYFLKVASNITVPGLCCFFGDAFVVGIFPQSRKIAKVVPLF